jgi:hypothetical protein
MKIALDYIKCLIDIGNKIVKIIKWQHRFVEEFNGRKNNLSHRKPQNTNPHCCMWFSKQNVI